MTMTETEIPRFASGITAVYGLSGVGKSALADTAAVYVAERFNMQTFCVANDPGGWGNRRLSLIRQGVMIVYDPSNHVNYFDTMEKLTKGAMPEKILDPDRGYADPAVPLIFPRQQVFIVRCPQGHEAARFTNQAIMMGSQTPCPTCGVIVTAQNQSTETALIRPAMFRRIGLRIFDSITAGNDRGLGELADLSARGELPTSGSGGSALGSADALRQGDTVFGTGSKAQVGFMQNRTYGWLVNIRAIPDQIIGAICTFGVEQSGGDDARGGGEICYGPALAGTARTARAGGWVGNLLHATKEPDDAGRIRHRLWLTNHIDPRDTFRRPYLAKHRGTPLGMPDYLEDPWSDDPKERERLASTTCSLKQFFMLLEAQYAQIAQEDQQKFATFREVEAQPVADEIVQAPMAVATPVGASVSLGTGGRSLAGRSALRRPGAPAAPVLAAAPAAAAPPVAAAAASAPPVPTVVTAGVDAAAAAEKSTIQQQLEASLAARQPLLPKSDGASEKATAAAIPAVPSSPAAPSVHSAPPPVAPPAPGRLRRAARPPTQ